MLIYSYHNDWTRWVFATEEEMFAQITRWQKAQDPRPEKLIFDGYADMKTIREFLWTAELYYCDGTRIQCPDSKYLSKFMTRVFPQIQQQIEKKLYIENPCPNYVRDRIVN
jgi:phenylpropionate dioxygenase-like ring-hydroxylating dioxygenase large terminal subunit